MRGILSLFKDDFRKNKGISSLNRTVFDQFFY